MFTGLIEKKGAVVSLAQKPGNMTQLVIDRREGEFNVALGDSVAVNGCCLTVVETLDRSMTFDVSRETLSRTSLGQLKIGDEVNLERALKVGDRLGGHWVLGHVDGVAQLEAVAPGSDGWELVVGIPKAFSRYLIPKGSICLQGVSLTINHLVDSADRTRIYLMLIPQTLSMTTFGTMSVGAAVNFEVDIAGKYFERFTALDAKS